MFGKEKLMNLTGSRALSYIYRCKLKLLRKGRVHQIRDSGRRGSVGLKQTLVRIIDCKVRRLPRLIEENAAATFRERDEVDGFMIKV